jgi:hypothetical protein
MKERTRPTPPAPTIYCWPAGGGWAAQVACRHGDTAVARLAGQGVPYTAAATIEALRRSHYQQHRCSCADIADVAQVEEPHALD